MYPKEITKDASKHNLKDVSCSTVSNTQGLKPINTARNSDGRKTSTRAVFSNAVVKENSSHEKMVITR